MLWSVGQGSGIVVSCGIGHRHPWNPELLSLWHRLAAAATIRPLARELPHATDAALKRKKEKKKERKEGRREGRKEGRKERGKIEEGEKKRKGKKEKNEKGEKKGRHPASWRCQGPGREHEAWTKRGTRRGWQRPPGLPGHRGWTSASLSS